MKNNIQHCAINVNNFEWYINFFQSTFNMTIYKKVGECPNRQVWFEQGIQLNEELRNTSLGNTISHIAIEVEDFDKTTKLALNNKCKLLKKANWIELPNGIVIELIK